jgi:hypothetical protein
MVCRFQGVQSATDRVRHVPFWGILVSKINGLPFSGVQPATDRVRHVPFWGILVFWKKLLQKSGHKTPPKRPKTAQNGPNRSKQAQNGPKRPKIGMRMSLFWTFLFLEKDFCQNQNMQHYVRFS